MPSYRLARHIFVDKAQKTQQKTTKTGIFTGFVAHPGGFEPLTYRFVAGHSIPRDDKKKKPRVDTQGFGAPYRIRADNLPICLQIVAAGHSVPRDEEKKKPCGDTQGSGAL